MNTPARLHKAEEKSATTFDEICQKIVPYVLFVCICLLIITVVVVLVKYGFAITGTEANIYYNHGGI